LLVLANSQKKGDRCIAGKLLIPNEGSNCAVGRWIRPIHPGNMEGEIPLNMTLIDNQWLAPLDVIEIGLAKPGHNPDHPEDWQIDPCIPWRRAAVVSKAYMPQLRDDPEDLWGEQFRHFTQSSRWICTDDGKPFNASTHDSFRTLHCPRLYGGQEG